MGNDALLEIVLQAKNQSDAAFKELKQQLGALQAEIGKTSRVAESGFNFGKLAVGATATAAGVVAAFKAMGQAVEMSQVGSQLEKQAASFGNLAVAAGSNSRKMLDDLKAVSRGLISESELIGSAGKAMLMGIAPTEITRLMEIAAATSRMTGQTMTEAFADITMGVARQSKMILDNLGIIVDVDKAYADYAKTLGKAADAMTDTEKRAAFMAAVMKSGEDMIKRLGAASGELEGVNKMLSAQKNLWDEISKTIASTTDKTLLGFADLVDKITSKVKSLRDSSSAYDRDEEARRIENNRTLERLGREAPGSTSEMMAAWNKRWGGASEAELASSASMQSWRKPDSFAAWREREGQWVDFTADEIKAMKEEREKYLKEVEEQKKKEQERIKQIWADYKPRYGPSQQSDAMMADQAAYDEWKKLWGGFNVRPGYSEAEEQQRKDDETYKEKLKKEFNAMTELSEETARAMQSNFSNLFFDSMTGELKSLEDYATAIFRSIQRAAADISGQMLTQGLFGKDMKGGGWLSDLGVWLKGLGGTGSAASGSSVPSGWVNAWTHHSGGMAGEGPSRPMPAWMFSGAERYHSGRSPIGPGERPAIIRDEEGVFTPEQMRALGDRRPNLSFSFNIASRDGRVDRDSIGQVHTAAYTAARRAWARNA